MKKKLIKMHNQLAMAKYRMTLSEQKLFIYAIRNINQEDSEFVTSTFTVSDFAESSELDLKYVYREIDNMTTGIMATVIFTKGDKESKSWKKRNLTQECDYDNGKIMFKFNKNMKMFLLQLQEHYYLQSPTVITFSSWYSMRLYDMFKAQLYKNKLFTIGLDELKEILDLEGKYTRFNNFREKVVDVAIDEINEKSDIKVEMERETKGRKVVGLIFTIKEKVEDDLDYLEGLNNISEIRTNASLMDAGFSDKQILKLYETTVDRFTSYRNAEDIYKYMSINYQYTKKMKKDGNIYGYYKTCLKDDYPKAISQILSGYIIDDAI